MATIAGPLVAGDSWNIPFLLKDVNLNQLDLNGYQLTLMFKRNKDDPDDQAVVSVSKTVTESTTQVDFEIDAADTEAIPDFVYHCGIKYIKPVSGITRTAEFRTTVIKSIIHG